MRSRTKPGCFATSSRRVDVGIPDYVYESADGTFAGYPLLAGRSSTPPRSAGYAVRPVETGGVRLEVGVDAHVRESALFGGTDKGVMARASIGW